MYKTFDLNTKSITETKQNLSKIIDDAKDSGEPTFILNHNKPEAVILSNDSYEHLIKNYEKLEEKIHDYEVQQRIDKHDSKDNPITYTTEDLGINLDNVEWSEDDGWE